MKYCPVFLGIIYLLNGWAWSAVYYVDYAGGNDEAAGTSAETAWKHAPGDANATGQPSETKLQPGDEVRFKGGVRYFGEIEIHASGTEGRLIIFDGNSSGEFGEGRAILDGARILENWQPVKSAEQVGGNPQWQEMVYHDLAVDLSSNLDHGKFVLHRDAGAAHQAPWQRIYLVDGEKRILPVAQQPKPSEPFFPDRPGDFYVSPHQLGSTYPHRIAYEEGSRGNGSLPVIRLTGPEGDAVIDPVDGGAVSIDLAQPEEIAELGFALYRPESITPPEQVEFLVDGQPVLTVDVDGESSELQRFKLPEVVEANQLTFRLRHSGAEPPPWTKLRQVAAFDARGKNVIAHEIFSVLRDEERLTATDAAAYTGWFVGVHGGNNHVYFARVQGFEPETHRLLLPQFKESTYKETQYAFFNEPEFIELPGEWALESVEEDKTRVYFLPEGGRPENIGYPVLQTAMSLSGAVSHIEIRGFLIQRYAGGKGGVALNRRGDARPSHIHISDCEVRFISGQSGISLNHSDEIVVEDCYVHHCPGWTVGIYVNRVTNYQVVGNRLDTNSGSGIRHYESINGLLTNNQVLNHYGMHSSGLNFYQGCRDIVFEGNYVENVVTINRSAENLILRNNVVDSERRNAFSVAMWGSGTTGGTFIRNVTIENNTLINAHPTLEYAASIFVQGHANPPEGLVIRNNILDVLRPPVAGTIENNIFMRETDEKVRGTGYRLVSEAAELFRGPEKGDYRRKPGGPMMDAGADVPPVP